MRSCSLLAAAIAATASLACQDPPATKLPDATDFTPDQRPGEGGNLIYLERAQTGAEPATAGTETVTVEVRAEQVEHLYGGTFVLAHDPTAMEIRRVTPGELVGTGMLATSMGKPWRIAGQVSIGFFLPAQSETGTIARVEIAARREGAHLLVFREPDYMEQSRIRDLISKNGNELIGIRWIGGTIHGDNDL